MAKTWSEPWPRTIGVLAPSMPERSCRGIDPLAFFPDLLSYAGGTGTSTNPMMAAAERSALRICSTCLALDECREWVLENVARLEIGVVGGTTEKERRRIAKDEARARRIAAYEAAKVEQRDVRSMALGVE